MAAHKINTNNLNLNTLIPGKSIALPGTMRSGSRPGFDCLALSTVSLRGAGPITIRMLFMREAFPSLPQIFRVKRGVFWCLCRRGTWRFSGPQSLLCHSLSVAIAAFAKIGKTRVPGAVCLSLRGGLAPICHQAHLPCDPPSSAIFCPAATSLRALLALRSQPKLLTASLSHIQDHTSPAARGSWLKMYKTHEPSAHKPFRCLETNNNHYKAGAEK